MSSNNTLLQVSDVKKTFGEVIALNGVTFDIKPGEVVGLVGSNGAGKTTLLRLMSGVYYPTSGNVTLGDGTPVHKMREDLGVVPESTGLYSRLTAWENIRYHSRLYGIDDAVAWKRTLKFAQSLDMEDNLSRYTKGFSRGMRQKTALLRALAHGPKVLLLDEPTAGLDITSARTVRALVEQIKQEGGTVVYSTHQLFEAQQVCDRIIIIHNGVVKADGSPAELLEETSSDSLEEAYVSLTQEKARMRFEDIQSDSGITRLWHKLFKPKTPYPETLEGESDE